MPTIIPAGDPKNTNAISQQCHERQQVMNEVYAKLAVAEAQHKASMGRPLADVLQESEETYGV